MNGNEGAIDGGGGGGRGGGFLVSVASVDGGGNGDAESVGEAVVGSCDILCP